MLPRDETNQMIEWQEKNTDFLKQILFQNVSPNNKYASLAVHFENDCCVITLRTNIEIVADRNNIPNIFLNFFKAEEPPYYATRCLLVLHAKLKSGQECVKCLDQIETELTLTPIKATLIDFITINFIFVKRRQIENSTFEIMNKLAIDESMQNVYKEMEDMQMAYATHLSLSKSPPKSELCEEDELLYDEDLKQNEDIDENDKEADIETRLAPHSRV